MERSLVVFSTVPFITHIDIFSKNNFICDIQLDEKCLIGGVRNPLKRKKNASLIFNQVVKWEYEPWWKNWVIETTVTIFLSFAKFFHFFGEKSIKRNIFFYVLKQSNEKHSMVHEKGEGQFWCSWLEPPMHYIFAPRHILVEWSKLFENKNMEQ